MYLCRVCAYTVSVSVFWMFHVSCRQRGSAVEILSQICVAARLSWLVKRRRIRSKIMVCV